MATRTQLLKDLTKVSSSIVGLDSMLAGGLPAHSITAVVGSAGSGKTVLALEILAMAASQRSEPGIFVAFEESARKLVVNAASFGWNLQQLMRRKLFFLDARLPEEAVQSGTFEITGLLASIAARASAMKARWVVFDAIDILLDLLPDVAMRRREILRLQNWIQDSGLTCILTAKSDSSTLGMTPANVYIAYMVECVIRLERRREGDLATRWISIEKYRGSGHTEAMMPYLIGAHGTEIEAMRVYTGGYKVYRTRISTGIPRLDSMLAGGLLRGSSTLVTGAPGTSKTTLAGKLAEAACQRGDRVLYVCFDEAGEEIVRNLESVDIRLAGFVSDGMLNLLGMSSLARSVEAQYAEIVRVIERERPRVVVIDPLSALLRQGRNSIIVDIGYRLVQECKMRGITLFSTSLIGKAAIDVETSEMHISTLVDTWIHLTYPVRSGERNRSLTIVKSRGSGHSNQVRELILSDKGITLADVFIEEGEVLMGTLRYQREEATKRQRQIEKGSLARERVQKKASVENLLIKIREQQTEVDQLQRELAVDADRDELQATQRTSQRERTSTLRHGDSALLPRSAP